MSGTQLLIAAVVTLVGGAAGGFLNALGTGEGFVRPFRKPTEHGSVWIPGSLYNIVIGAFAGFISWILYGGISLVVVNSSTSGRVDNAPFVLALLTAFASAFLIGFGGAKWLTSESEKQIAKLGASIAADKGPSSEASRQIASASSPLEVLRIAENMPDVAGR
jgi:hypothetical protein